MPVFFTRFFCKKSVVYVFCSNASPMYFSFSNIFLTVLSYQRVFPLPVRMPSRSKPLAILIQLAPSRYSRKIRLIRFCLFRIYHQLSVSVFIIAQKTGAIHHNLPLLKAILHSNFYILTKRFRLLLCKRRQNCQHNFTALVGGFNALFLEKHRDILVLQLADKIQATTVFQGKTCMLFDDNICQFCRPYNPESFC